MATPLPGWDIGLMPITLGTSAIHGTSGEALMQAMDRALAVLGSGVTVALLIVGMVGS